jgi:hypothetical protein
MRTASQVMAVLILAAVLVPSSGGGSEATASFRPGFGEFTLRPGWPRPVPWIIVRPDEAIDVEEGPSTGVARSLAWDPTNWRVNSDTTTEVQNEEQVVANPLDPDNLVAVWRDFRLGYRRVAVGYSFDGGVTWNDFLMVEPHYTRQSDPGLTVDRFGNFYMVVLSYTGNTSEENGLFVQKSTDGGVTWGGSVEVIDQFPNVFEDKELIACDRTGGAHDGNLYVVWTRFGYTLEIMSARSTDGGLGFQSPVDVSDGSSSVQWPVPVVGPDGTYYVAWVQYVPSEIRIDRSFDGGATFGSDITVADVWTAQTDLNGGIATFSFPAMDCDITGGAYNGRLYVAYMDRVYADFDIFLTHSDDHGATWSPRIRINDDAISNGRDQFHPWLCVSDDGAVNVIFYDRRNDPANLLMDLYVAQSFDGGASFEPNRRVTTVSSDPTAGTRAGLLGEYIGLAAPSAARLHPVWTDTREGNQDVYTSIIDTTFTGMPDGQSVSRLRLAAPTPNPFTGATSASFRAAPGSAVELLVVDVSGRVVRRIRAVASEDGRGALAWDGADEHGRPVGSGVYFLRASGGSETAVAKSVLLR